MKKGLFYMLTVVSTMFFINCSNGSSGSAMLDLDIRILPSKSTTESLDHASRWSCYSVSKQYVDDFLNLFTVLPGPYEFTWEELKNEDHAMGYEICSTKLKVKLRLNKTLKINFRNEQENLDGLKSIYRLEMFNSEGKTSSQLSDENDDEHSMMLLDAELFQIQGIDGKIGIKDNTDAIRDFYHFLTSKPGTEMDFTVDCGTQLCKEIENQMEYSKGFYIFVDVPDITMTRSHSEFQIE